METIESLEFIFTTPTFVPNEVTDPVRRERREFHIPKLERERGFYGTEFEIRLKNKLTQRAIAKECADWMRRKATFRSNRSKAPMQQFACLRAPSAEAVYMPLHGFTAVDLGYQQGNAVSNMVNRMDEPPITATYINLFDQIWNDKDIRDFRGAMVGRTDKGLFMTTGSYTPDAQKEATRDGAPAIDLIDGEQLCELLKTLKLGVTIKMVEEVSVEADWFNQI